MGKLTNEQEAHLRDIKYRFLNDTDAKYRKGAEKHGSNLLDMSAEQLLDEAIAEALDQYTYLVTLKTKLVDKSPRPTPSV